MSPKEKDQSVAVPAPQQPLTALQEAFAEIGRLSGIIHDANAERDKAKAERDQAVRDEQEWRGIVETYGLVQHTRLASTDQERMVFTVDSWTLKAAGQRNAVMLWVDGLRKCVESRFKSVPSPLQRRAAVNAAQDVQVQP